MTSQPILVAGLVNLETTLAVDGFPVDYAPVRYPFFGVHTAVSGVGYNIARALTRLGHPVRLVSLVGQDAAGALVRQALTTDGIAHHGLRDTLAATPQSVVQYDPAGRRAIHTDLKDAQDATYPIDTFESLLDGCRLAVLCNINWTRPLLTVARSHNVTVVSDVHAIGDLHDAYNTDYMRAADVLFMSHEALPTPAVDFARNVQTHHGPKHVCVGMGAAGVLLSPPVGASVTVPAHAPRGVVNTVGAGDALLSAFVSGLQHHGNAYRAAQEAVVFAGWQIGETGAANGLLTRAELDALCAEHYGWAAS